MAYNIPPEELNRIFGTNIPPLLNHNSQLQAIQSLQQQIPDNNKVVNVVKPVETNPFANLSSNGEATLDGIKFVLHDGANTADGITINTPRIVLKDGSTLMYWDDTSKTYKPLAGSEVLQVIKESTKIAKQPPPVLSTNEQQAMLSQMQQFKPNDIPTSTSQLVKPEEFDKTTLFENPMSILLLVGFGIFALSQLKK